MRQGLRIPGVHSWSPDGTHSISTVSLLTTLVANRTFLELRALYPAPVCSRVYIPSYSLPVLSGTKAAFKFLSTRDPLLLTGRMLVITGILYALTKIGLQLQVRCDRLGLTQTLEAFQGAGAQTSEWLE